MISITELPVGIEHDDELADTSAEIETLTQDAAVSLRAGARVIACGCEFVVKSVRVYDLASGGALVQISAVTPAGHTVGLTVTR